ncbi:unnamed protein product [Ceutorhynchus assimilis]|uniref:MARVEL domain-containing protein n=1 Tax=Ceutorhynchus assimilis TaxID=467358 RepID=A0A9N9MRX0_9CUCU|nr:unnamed protein product [Ceutorhynchus assimilis]
MSQLINTTEKQVTDSENKLEDEQDKSTMRTFFRRRWQLCAKSLELILCILCIGLIMEPVKKSDTARVPLHHLALIFPTFIGYLLIVLLCLLAKILGDKIPYRTGFIFSVVASCLFFVSGILLAVDRRKPFMDFQPLPYVFKLLASSAAFSFVTAIIFSVEAVYVWKFREDF